MRPAPGLSRRYPAAAAGPSPAERAEQRPVSALRGVGTALAARLVRVIRRMSDVTRVTRTIAAHARSEHTADETDTEADSDSGG